MTNNFYNIEVLREGVILPEFIINHDDTILHIKDGFAFLYLVVDAPTPQLVKSLDIINNRLSFAMVPTNTFIDVCVQVGNGIWMDTAVKPDLEQGLCPLFEKGTGMGMTCMVVDGSDGRILQMRTFSLSTEFSNQLATHFNTLLENPCTGTEYLMSVAQLHDKFSAQELAQMAKVKQTIRKSL